MQPSQNTGAFPGDADNWLAFAVRVQTRPPEVDSNRRDSFDSRADVAVRVWKRLPALDLL